MADTTKYTLSALPLPPSSHTLTKNLTPDPLVPSPALFRNVQLEKPSIQRRARLLDTAAHFSYCAPYPAAFPYRITPPEDKDDIDQAAFVEKWLAGQEAVQERGTGGSLNKFYPDETALGERTAKLIGLAETGLRDCLPHLDVGDALALLGTPSLVAAAVETQEEPAQENAARSELIDVLSGGAVLANVDVDPERAWAPWSLRYSGHQFGTWAGQLGDGRAISVLVTPHPEDPELTYELQLKGAGRTPFSRSADGLAVVRSSIREFLCAEAMHALGIPTTRSLTLISLPSVPVEREKLEYASILTRMAPSFIRIGSFEALNPPERMFFLGGGQQDPHHDALRVLGEWVAKRVLRLPGIRWSEEGVEGDAWGRELVLEVARRNARMVAGWQAYGFMHGVINTDNVSILGLTIDYGPYAFMDVFDQYHVCNHSDAESRYAYLAQPSVILFALRALLNALSPLIGAEIARGNKAVPPKWADEEPAEQIKTWSKEGKEAVLQDLEDIFQNTCAEEYKKLMHKRLGLRQFEPTDESELSRPLLDLMADHSLDFHGTFRRLAYFHPSMADATGEDGATPALDAFAESLLALTPEPEMVDKFKAKADFKTWLQTYAERVQSERAEWESEGDVDAARERAMGAANPRFVLRQWVLEEVIKKVEKDADVGKRVLAKVLKMACSPFEPWGAEDDPTPEDSLDPEVKEERRYCGLGEKTMLGFQCSCSS